MNSRIKRRKIDITNAVTGEIIHKFRGRFTGIDSMRIAEIHFAITAFSITGIRIKGERKIKITKNSGIKRRKIGITNAVTGEIIHKFRERFTGIDFMRIAKIRLAITAFSNTGIRIKGRGGIKVAGEVSQKRFPIDFGKGFNSFKKARLSYSSVPKSLVATFTNTII